MTDKKKKILLYTAAGLGLAAGAYGLYRLMQKRSLSQAIATPIKSTDLLQDSAQRDLAQNRDNSIVSQFNRLKIQS